MTKRKELRRARLLPGGVPKYVRCYDLGPDGPADRYTVIYTGHYVGKIPGWPCYCVGMSSNPYHPQGIGAHWEYQEMIDAKCGWAPQIGRRCHLGVRIPFKDLPKECRHLVMRDYKAIWNLYKNNRE